MAGKPRIDTEEVDIRLRPGRGERQRPLVPWWMRLEKRYLGAGRKQVRSKRGSNARIADARPYQRRSVVKVMYTRNGKPKPGAWPAHARYLTREGAQRENEKGVGFDAARGDIDMVARVREWEKAGDQRMWRVIVSPEDADRLDLKEHVRELVREMEGDLGTRLEWVAIDHSNTDNPHAHLLVRGVDDRGKSLMIDWEYVRANVRARSQESSITLVSFRTTRLQKYGPSRKCIGSNSWKGWGWGWRADWTLTQGNCRSATSRTCEASRS